MSEPHKLDAENIIRLLEKLDLHPVQQQDQTTYLAICPKDRAHQMVVDQSTNQWECKICSIGGGTLELSYQTCLSALESLNESINRDMDALNALIGKKLRILEINEGTIQQLHNNAHMQLLQGIIKKKELFQQKFRVLDQYRLSIMVQDLKEGKELNDDIQRWWINRY